MHVVSIQTTDERGGAEYANVDLLNELGRRGVRSTYLTNLPELADGTDLTVREIDLGPKLSRRSLRTLAGRVAALRVAPAVRAARRLALRRAPAALQEGAAALTADPAPPRPADRVGRVGAAALRAAPRPGASPVRASARGVSL